ncbi:3-deoxy-D-manno-octulosonic acid transferase [Chryseobacterium oryzae]|uniref:3-deoxy-D-manno-octulosonic acid transferase n=1 Tax=Chryseobacterium oryzae TaxID=2929799 RepID=A0ABY4BFC8_9FLAO|nr:glycosyltransferase N-terminal domain-containing protein [Chryseobacterium oryzae]UOE37866.1 3-deoxy-D-manno-octulosonic acid transferase [Chryseobacterium oryzae]
MSFLYTIFVYLLTFGMKVLSLFHDKTKKGVEGRKQSLDIVKSAFSPSDKVLWMHAASLGEYEQGLPVLEKLKENFPSHKVLVTFFSPSGYENVIKKKHAADAICYLPFDRKKTVKEFASQFNCQIFFTVKYDYWYHLLAELRSNNVNVFVISALFYENQAFFKTYGKWFVNQLKKNITWFFHQTHTSYVLAKSIGLLNSSVSGDTRFDRVKQLRERDNYVEYIEEFIGDKKTVVFGSSWSAEEKIAKMVHENNSKTKIIIAPHDLKRVEFLKNIFPEALLYSELKNSENVNLYEAEILVIDCIGLLSKLYSYADVAVVGGGFHDAGLHNILEAATFGVPVIFGNQYKKNPEADGLIAAKGAKSFDEEKSAANFVLKLLKDEKLLAEMSLNAENFVIQQPNSTALIIKKILSL